jgi:hypothetical protein
MLSPRPTCSLRHAALAAFTLVAAAGCAIVDSGEETPPAGDGGMRPRDGALPECGAPVDCADENPCTDDRCTDGFCAHVPMEAGAPCRDNDLCNGDEACDAAGACQPGTAVVCEPAGPCQSAACDATSGRCVETPYPDCCVDDADCARPGESACTATRCNPETRACEPTRVPGCCEVDADCATEPCVLVTCNPDKHTCDRRPEPECCTSDADCPAGACATASCDAETRRCGGGPIADCCLHDGDCPAPGACSTVSCDPASNRCETARIEGCCVDDRDCGPGRTCDPAVGACVLQPVECCTMDAECGAPAGCIVPTCVGGDTCCALRRLPDCCDGDLDCPVGMRCAVAERICVPNEIEYAAIQFPVTPIALCAGDPTPLLFGRVYVAGRTPGAGAGAFVDAEVGYGPAGLSPDDPLWTYVPGVYNGDLINSFGDLNDDEYRGEFAAPAAAEWEIAWRFRVNDGAWVYADLGPAGSTDGYASATALALHTEDCARLPVQYAAFQHPLDAVEICAGEDTPPIFGRVFVAGRTPGAGPGGDLLADLGYGPAESSPGGVDAAAWRWTPALYNGDLYSEFGELSDDEYRAVLTVLPVGTWALAWRFSTTGGEPAFGDLPPSGSIDGFDPATTLTVTVRDDCP